MRRPRTSASRAAVAALLIGGLAVLPALAPATAVPRASVGGGSLDQPGVQVAPKPDAKAKPVPPVVAASWLVADADTGEVLAAKNAHVRHLPASTLKTLTAVALLDQLDPEATYTPTYEDIAVEGSKVGIVNGSRYTVDQLWYGLFLASGNDTARALAHMNGGMKPTVEEMNATARRLQANDTVAKNDSGLDADGQTSSAYDLALIARAGLQMPRFEKYAKTVSVKFPRAGKKAKRKTFMVYNHNPLVIGGYPGAIGVKTGYTDAARRTFVGAARHGDRTLIVTIMKYEGITYRTAEALLDWGFKNADRVEPVGQLVDPLPADPGPAAARKASDRSGASSAEAQTSAGISSGSSRPALWPFALAVLAVVGLSVWLLRGSRAGGDPLAAANRGRGRGRRRASSTARGRDGVRRY